jgi:regulator of protease activity HflC (stomatin/prohibitin superfamily)
MTMEQEGKAVQDPYRAVSLVLLAAAILGMTAAFVGGIKLANSAMLAAGINLGLAASILAGVLKAQSVRMNPPKAKNTESAGITGGDSAEAVPAADAPSPERISLLPPVKRDIVRLWRWIDKPDLNVQGGIAFAWATTMAFVLMQPVMVGAPSLQIAIVAAVLFLVAAGLAAIAARYLAEIDPALFPESVGLCRGARVLVWILVLAAVAVALAWARLESIYQVLYFGIMLFDAALCYSLFRAQGSKQRTGKTFPQDSALLSVLGSRPNILASVLDAAEQQLGIDLRSTWALTIVRRTLEPLLICLCLAGWLSTSLTVVGVDEQGLVERLGVPQAGRPLAPGLHLHWPWPIDRVFRVPVARVMDVQVGHEGEESEGSENVLWAVEHAPNEYTLVLANGRDLITVDADVQYPIVDAHAWRYNCQNSEDALRAIAYRAVMRSTVNLTLTEAVSQNISVLTAKMRAMVQKDADDMGLGVHILAYTVGGMHPPVPVAPAYEAVVSAQLEAATATTNAQVFRNQTVPAAQSDVITGENTARAEGAQALALAAGQAWSFRALESQYRAAPGEYFFRRRLETLEQDLPRHRITVVDNRFLRDGGEIWQTH